MFIWNKSSTQKTTTRLVLFKHKHISLAMYDVCTMYVESNFCRISDMSTANIPANTCPLKFYQNIMTDGNLIKFMHT